MLFLLCWWPFGPRKDFVAVSCVFLDSKSTSVCAIGFVRVNYVNEWSHHHHCSQRPLTIAAEAWRLVLMDFIFRLLSDSQDRMGILFLLIDSSRWSTGTRSRIDHRDRDRNALCWRCNYHHGLLKNIVSDRDLLFTYAFWTSLSEIPGTKLKMSIAAHSETDGQTERMKRVL